MTTIAKFYFHDAATTDTGTLPTSSVSATTPNAVDTTAQTNRSMNGTIGASQASTNVTTVASKTQQNNLHRRFLSAPIAAQTIAAQAVSLHGAVLESNTNSNIVEALVLAVWRPSTGALVGRLFDLATLSWNGSAFTVEQTGNNSATSAAVTAASGDILVAELWTTNVQGKASAYTNQVFYDGTTEDNASSNASYVLFTTAITMASGSQSVTTTDAPTTAEAVTTSKQLLRTATDGPTTAETVDWVGALNRFGFNPPR